MEWLAANWFWVFIGVLFVGVHLFGHGGHGGHGGGGCGHGGKDSKGKPGTGPDGHGHQH